MGTTLFPNLRLSTYRTSITTGFHPRYMLIQTRRQVSDDHSSQTRRSALSLRLAPQTSVARQAMRLIRCCGPHITLRSVGPCRAGANAQRCRGSPARPSRHREVIGHYTRRPPGAFRLRMDAPSLPPRPPLAGPGSRPGQATAL